MRPVLKNKNLSNSIWNIIDIFLYPVIFFISVPVFIEKLGTEGFGIWMLVNTIIIGMQVFNFGIGPAVLKNIAHYAGVKDTRTVKDILNYSISINLILFILSLLITAVLAILVYRAGMWNVSVSSRKITAWCIALSGWIIGLRFLEQVLTNYYKGIERYREAAFITTGNRMIPLLINIVLLYTLPVNVAVLLSVIIGCNIVVTIFAYRAVSNTTMPYRFSFCLKTKIQISRFALLIWLQSLGMILIFQMDRYLVVSYFGLSVLSYYALTATIFNHLHMGFNAIIGWVSPKFTKLRAAGGSTWSLYFSAQYLLTGVATVALVILYCLYPIVFPMVLGKEYAAELSTYVPSFIIFELFFVTGVIPVYYLNATGFEKKYLYLVVLFVISSLICMLVFIRQLASPEAVLYGLIVSCIINMFLQQYFIALLVFKTKLSWFNPVRLLLPPLLASAYIHFSAYPWSWLILCVCLLSVYYCYIKGNVSRFQLLFRS